MSPISLNALIELAIDLSHSLVDDDRFERLLTHIRKAINCDAVVLLTLQGDFLKPLAQQGLTTEVLGRRFDIQQHPRFIEICQAKMPVRFDSESELPDPYDGLLLATEGDLPVHSCMGLPLLFAGNLIGVLTLDSLTPNEFDDIPARTLDIISAISSAALKNALTLELYQRDASHARAVVEELTQTALTKDGGELIGDSEPMLRLKQEIQIVAGSDFTALIQGETGVGKELVARTIHQQSNRNNGPLVYVNCAALPENLIESELFGHVKGAFTGASQNRSGKFTIANNGTLFLDEIGEMPLQVQSKLLRALQSQEIQPVGQDKTHKVDVRIIAATNRDLQQEVEKGEFRADLYHRLSVYPLTVPPLRLRRQDIVLLSGYFVELMRRKLGLQQIKFAAEVMPYLSRYDWPGNIRELEHCINRAALKARSRSAVNEAIIAITQGDIGLLQTDHEMLPDTGLQSESVSAQLSAASASPTAQANHAIEPVNNLKHATEQFQRQCILQALDFSKGNWAAAARQLDMDRANLSRMAKRLNIQVERSVRG